MYHFINEQCERFYDMNPEDKDKYIVVCVAKNEDKYIREWIDHYLNLGFDKIMIGDNNDEPTLQNTLSDYLENGTVELFNCKGLKKFQYQFYTMFSEVGNYKWAGFFDCDEFLEIPLFNNIKEYLNRKQDEVCICFNWLLMSNNGDLYETGQGVKERFKYPLMTPNNVFINRQVKSIVNGNYKCTFISNPHIPVFYDDVLINYGGKKRMSLNRNFTDVIDYRDGYIKHYQSKSFIECIEKYKRGYPDGGELDNSVNIFKSCKQRNYPDIYDYTKYSVTLQSNPIEQFREIVQDYDIINILLDDSDVDCMTPIYYDYCMKVIELAKGKHINFIGTVLPELYSLFLGYCMVNDNTISYTENEEEYFILNKNKRCYLITINSENEQ